MSLTEFDLNIEVSHRNSSTTSRALQLRHELTTGRGLRSTAVLSTKPELIGTTPLSSPVYSRVPERLRSGTVPGALEVVDDVSEELADSGSSSGGTTGGSVHMVSRGTTSMKDIDGAARSVADAFLLVADALACPWSGRCSLVK